MIGRFLTLALAAIGATATLVDRDTTLTINGQDSSDFVIIATTAGNGAPWTSVKNSPMAIGQTHTVVVGGPAGNYYQPDTISAAMGDLIQFNFLTKNHSLTQSSFSQPCVNAKSFDAGFIPNPTGTNPPPGIRVQVMTTNPTWFYCRQKGHCGTGMVFSVNPTAAKTQAMFKAAAIAQNGTASTGAPPPPAAVPAASSASSATVVSPAIATGTGTMNANGQCSCSCLCGAGSFGNLNTQNQMGAFGGFGGMLSPAPGSK